MPIGERISLKLGKGVNDLAWKMLESIDMSLSSYSLIKMKIVIIFMM
ncbi:hypothetical protein N779_09130 [Vibrio coralliilyticus OCN008]|nr:hypothetical protein N779_09130 [Vibrio coralliilyticus OCN008]